MADICVGNIVCHKIYCTSWCRRLIYFCDLYVQQKIKHVHTFSSFSSCWTLKRVYKNEYQKKNKKIWLNHHHLIMLCLLKFCGFSFSHILNILMFFFQYFVVVMCEWVREKPSQKSVCGFILFFSACTIVITFKVFILWVFTAWFWTAYKICKPFIASN